MTHHEVVVETCTAIIDALGMQIEPINLAELVEASVKEKRKIGKYGVKQNAVEELFERLRENVG